MNASPNARTHVFLGVFDFGDDLKAVAKIIDVKPTESWLRGDPIPNHPTGRRTHSRWSLHSGLPTSASFEDHIEALLDKLEPIAGQVRTASATFRAVVWAAIYTSDPNPGWRITSSVTGRLAALGIGLDIDFYSLPDESLASDNPGPSL